MYRGFHLTEHFGLPRANLKDCNVAHVGSGAPGMSLSIVGTPMNFCCDTKEPQAVSAGNAIDFLYVSA
jgi:hypothetical protein